MLLLLTKSLDFIIGGWFDVSDELRPKDFEIPKIDRSFPVRKSDFLIRSLFVKFISKSPYYSLSFLYTSRTRL